MFGQHASLQTTQRSVSRIMWVRLFFVIFVGAASAEHFRAWKTDTEYEFNIHSRTLTGLQDVIDQYTGIVLRARLTVRPKSEDTLEAKVWNAQYAQIHTKLRGDWKTKIPDNELDLKDFPISEKVFVIKMRNGVVSDLIVEADVRHWELNVLKSIVSQLQVDTQRENLIAPRYNQEPEDDRNIATFKTMEDSVGGKCEVLYEISNLSEFTLQRSPELLPMPQLRGEGEAIDIVKTKNYRHCEQRTSHYFDMTGSNKWEPGANGRGKFMSRSSVSRIVVTGNLKNFTIQSSATTNEVVMRPSLHENQEGIVGSWVNVTLEKMGPVSSVPWSTPAYPSSTGNLVYSFDSPIALVDDDPYSFSSLCRFTPDNSEEQPRGYNVKFKRQVDNDDDSSKPPSTEGFIFLQSDEEQSYWQWGAPLDHPPSTPLLPFFDRTRIRSVKNFEEVDLVAAAKRVASQIGSDLQNPNNITDEQTLEKFTILARLIRTMNTKQIDQVQSEVYQSENEIDTHNATQSVRSDTWAAFRDAVAQAGTGPALLTIKKWIKEKIVKGYEAASIVGVLSQTARTPIPEYLDAFFELTTMPETTDQEFLNATALFTFAELVRYTEVNHQRARNGNPVRKSHRSPKHNPAILRDYVPYMSEQLKKSIEDNDAAKSHVFIRALGNIGHHNILAIFEPYLEGKKPSSTFQRTLMVFSMDKLASLRPKLARGVLYKIYRNTSEAHQVRCAAVVLLMLTNPPETMLGRMAEFTNRDHSKHVNAAVKSAIESASELRTDESQVLAEKARKVRFLLTKESYGRRYSRNDFGLYKVLNRFIAQHSHGYLGSADGFFPQAYYASMKPIYGDFQAAETELAAMVSSVKDLYRKLAKQFQPHNKNSKENHREFKFTPENIAKLLKIEDEDEENLEGLYWTRSEYNSDFMSFDKHSLRRIPELLKKATASLKEGLNLNMAKLVSYDLALTFPMESGFPFVYTLKVPTLLKTSGSVKGENAPNAVQGTIDLRFVYSTQVQARLGFVTPFGHRHYMAGVNKNLQVYVPIHAEVKYDKSEKQVTLKIQPIEQNEKNKIVHYSIVPFTSHYNILDSLPVMKDNQTQKITTWEMTTMGSRTSRPTLKQRYEQHEIGGRTRGMNFRLEMASADPFPDKYRFDWDISGSATFPFTDGDITARSTELIMIPNPTSEQSVILTGSLQTLEDDTTKSDENISNSSPDETVAKIDSKKINDPERRSALLETIAEGMAAANAFVIDVGVELPGQEPLTGIMTMAFANSDVDETFRCLSYWRYTDDRSQSSMVSCVRFSGRDFRSFFTLDGNKTSFPSRIFDADVLFGNTCEEGYKIEIRGKQEQTDAFKETLYEPAMSECRKEIKSGMKSTPACLDARLKTQTMDKSRIVIKLDPAIGTEVALQAFKGLTSQFPQLKLSHMEGESIENNTVVISVTLAQTKPKHEAMIEIKMADLRSATTYIDIDAYADALRNIHTHLSMKDLLDMNADDYNFEQYMCVIDSESATTFDKVIYPVDLGKCWHVAMTTYPKKNKDNNTATDPIDEDMQVSVVVRDAEENKKEANIVLGKDVVKLTLDDSEISVQLNGKTVDFSEKPYRYNLRRECIYRQKNHDGDLDFEIIQRADDSIMLSSSKYHVAVTYDGERLQIEASGLYRNNVRGLCGNYDSEPANDFTSPKNCVLSKPEHFVGSYAITSSECQGQALENARNANEADCTRNTVRPGDPDSKSDDWNQPSHPRHHCTTKRNRVLKTGDEICFSAWPMLSCAVGCKPLYTESDGAAPMYCMPVGETAQQIIDRIEQGADFDFQKNITIHNYRYGRFDTPVHCYYLPS